jgi:hypothetical protein
MPDVIRMASMADLIDDHVQLAGGLNQLFFPGASKPIFCSMPASTQNVYAPREKLKG